MALQVNHIYDRHVFDKNTVRKDVKCRQFIAYYVLLVGHWFTLVVPDRNGKEMQAPVSE